MYSITHLAFSKKKKKGFQKHWNLLKIEPCFTEAYVRFPRVNL